MKHHLRSCLIYSWMWIRSNAFLRISPNLVQRSFDPSISKSFLLSRAMTTTTTSPKTPDLPVLTGIRDIVDRYDTFLLDMWYVFIFCQLVLFVVGSSLCFILVILECQKKLDIHTNHI